MSKLYFALFFTALFALYAETDGESEETSVTTTTTPEFVESLTENDHLEESTITTNGSQPKPHCDSSIPQTAASGILLLTLTTLVLR